LAAQDSSAGLARRLRRYCKPALLLLDEVGYLSYDGRYGDLLEPGERESIAALMRELRGVSQGDDSRRIEAGIEAVKVRYGV
jgi:hypothetical protein